MYHKHHTKGLIISSRLEGDSNRRVDILTESFGLLSASIQGARNTYSKLRASSQDFSFGEFSLVHGKAGWKVVSARSEENFYEQFRGSPLKLRIAGNIFNLLKRLVSEDARLTDDSKESSEDPRHSVFEIVSNFFHFLVGAKEEEIVLSECLTLLRVLHCLGYMRHDPELSVPISSCQIRPEDLEIIAPRRAQMVLLINESLKAA